MSPFGRQHHGRLYLVDNRIDPARLVCFATYGKSESARFRKLRIVILDAERLLAFRYQKMP